MSDDLVQIARSRIDDTQRTHWEGCERDHRECLIQRMADEIERWRAAAEYAAHQLERARIWNGMDWHYNPLHPLHYRSALERLRDVLRA